MLPTIALLRWVVQKDVHVWRGRLAKEAKSERGEKVSRVAETMVVTRIETILVLRIGTV